MISNLEQNALIIFARYPVLGKVKTRLASSFGKEFALGFYKECSKHLFTEIEQNQNEYFTPFLFCSEKDELNKMIDWVGQDFEYYYQEGSDLGERINNAFNKVFTLDAKKAIIIGTDIPDVSNKLITGSFKLLDEKDFVIGPSTDGGYYLLGMKNLDCDLFSGIKWSTESVLDETVNRMIENNCSYTKLEHLHDIDDERSLKLWMKQHSKEYDNLVFKFVKKKLSF
ncbi:MAG: TIGR04282 family arsenosugar biosynthesis glycosyltransferase [Ignavibacteria bacterium]|nr:TIGR04282 family arsenosugar biosynthesis glycosyltransferase [Ignavibacteria bacterium]